MSIIAHSVHSIKHVVDENVRYKPIKAFDIGLKDGFKGNLLSAPFIAFEASSAQRGEQLATLTGRVSGLVTYPALSGVMAAGLAMIPGVNVAAGLIASIVAMYPNSLLEESTIRRINWLNQTGKNIQHLETGGKYVDSDYARNARHLSLMELSSASGSARRYLGNEAMFHHR